MVMTPAERNRALAEALEPTYELQQEVAHGTVIGWTSPLRMWRKPYYASHPTQPRDFHTDGNAMLALIDALKAVGWRLFSASQVEFKGVYAVSFRGAQGDIVRGEAATFIEAVALAASRALGVEQ